MATKSRVPEAYARAKEVFARMRDMGARPMECTEDKCGIVWERYVLPNGLSAIVFATPSWWDVFVPVTNSVDTERTLDAIEAAGKATVERLT